MARDRHFGNTFAHTMVTAAVEKVALPLAEGEEVTPYDRLAVITGSTLEQAEANTGAIVELTKAVVDGNTETHRLLKLMVDHQNGNGKSRKDKFKAAALPVSGGVGGGVGFAVVVSQLLPFLRALLS